jgi:hypothetical protein
MIGIVRSAFVVTVKLAQGCTSKEEPDLFANSNLACVLGVASAVIAILISARSAGTAIRV